MYIMGLVVSIIIGVAVIGAVIYFLKPEWIGDIADRILDWMWGIEPGVPITDAPTPDIPDMPISGTAVAVDPPDITIPDPDDTIHTGVQGPPIPPSVTPAHEAPMSIPPHFSLPSFHSPF
jgi:hypothetical protein